MSDLNALCRDLVTANHILAREGVTDALGHISVRHPDRPDRFFLSCSRSPELVKPDDIMEYDLDCNPVDQRGRPMYVERPIHGAIFQARVARVGERLLQLVKRRRRRFEQNQACTVDRQSERECRAD